MNTTTTAYSNQRERSEGVSLLALLTAGLAAIMAVTAFGFSIRNKGASAGATISGPVVKANVSLSDFAIKGQLASFPSGPIQLNVINKGPSPHSLTVTGVATTKNLAVGETALLDLGTLEPGTYKWFCKIAGHAEAGMKGTFVVSPKTSGGLGSALGGNGATSQDPATTGEDKPDYAAVDTAHANVVKQFLAGPPAKTEGLGGQKLAPTIENGVKVFSLETTVVQWEVAPGARYEAWTYNGTVPGPEIRVKQGETIKVRLKNSLPESTSIHWHGVEIADNKQDGVTFVTQDPIKPGQTYEYTLTPINCGSHMYHSHHAADAQVPLGLLGPFVVDCVTTPVPAFASHDSEYTEVLSDGPLGFSINGKGFPATAPVVAKVGEKTLVRFMNEGLIIHPMHLHGHRMLVVAKDGNYLPAPYEADTLNIAPGERYDVIVTSLYPGAWAFHCHILTHAESDQGLHGMTTVWLVKP